MDRRTLLGGAAAAVMGGVVFGSDIATAAPRRRPAALWEDLGGFVPAGYVPLRAANLAVYADGLMIADADRYAWLRPGILETFTGFAERVLRNPANGIPRPGAPVIADAPATRFTVRRRGRTWSISAEALEASRRDRTYPRPLYALLDRFAAHRDRALTAGDPFRPEAVRLVAVRVDEPPTTPVPAWPADVPVPVLSPDQFWRVLDLRGPAARATIRGIAHREPWEFTAYRTANGTFLRAAWRRLLPHE